MIFNICIMDNSVVSTKKEISGGYSKSRYDNKLVTPPF